MRPTRGVLLVAATALAPALLLTGPAFAADAAPSSVGVTAAAETDDPGTPVDEMSDEELRIAILRILADPDSGKGVKRAATEALETDTPEAARAFLETGYRLARAEDDRVAVALMLADPNISDALRAAAEEVIDGTPEELRYLLEVGQYEVDK